MAKIKYIEENTDIFQLRISELFHDYGKLNDYLELKEFVYVEITKK